MSFARAFINGSVAIWGAGLIAACSSSSPATGGATDAGAMGSGGSGTGGGTAIATGGQTGGGTGGSAATATGGATSTATGGVGVNTGGAIGSGGAGAGGATASSGGAGAAGFGGGGGSTGGRSGGGASGAAANGGRGASAGGAGGAGGLPGATTYSPCPPLPAACKILPFGDSITFGVGSNGSGSNGGYRVELFHRAHQDGKSITFVGTSMANGPTTVDGVTFPRNNEGHSGYTIDDEPATAAMVARIGISPLVATVMPATKPDIVTLMIGTNDIQHDIDVTNAPTRLGKLIDSIIAADAHTLVVVAQIVPTTDATVNVAVKAYNAAIPALVNARAAAGKHVILVDMYQAISSDPNFQTTGLTVPANTVGPMFDWLHPNVAGYKLMGDAWYEVLKGALR